MKRRKRKAVGNLKRRKWEAVGNIKRRKWDALSNMKQRKWEAVNNISWIENAPQKYIYKKEDIQKHKGKEKEQQ